MKSNKIINYDDNTIECICCEQFIDELQKAKNFHIYEVIYLKDKAEYLINIEQKTQTGFFLKSEE